MKFEKTTQYRSEEGIVFNLSQITLMESDRGRLRELHFGEAKRAHYQVNSMVVDMYDRMQPRNLPCLLTVCIANPLTRQQADAINAMRGNVAKGIAAASGGVAGRLGALGGPLISWASGAVVTAGVNGYLKGALPTLHAGDVLVSIEGKSMEGLAHSALSLRWSSRSKELHMPYIMQTVVLLVLGAILVQFLKPYSMRKWLGLALLAAGLVSMFKVGEHQVLGFDLDLLALLAVPLGVVLFLTRRRFKEGD